MLIDFRFENFRSYRRESRLQLARNGEVNRIAAIYGPNASGKTNVINALAMMRGMVLGSSSLNSTDKLGFQPFVLAVKEKKPEGLFEVTFSFGEGVWRYGFSFDAAAITAEWLFGYRDLAGCFAGEGRQIYVRDGLACDGESQEARDLLPKTLPNMLLLAKLDQDNDELAHKVMGWFRNLVIIRAYSDDDLYSYSHNQLVERGQYARRMMELLRFADPTVAAVRKVPAKLETGWGREADERLRDYAKEHGLQAEKIELVRRAVDEQALVPLPFDEFESAGTQKMFCLSGPLTDILEHGYTLVVDEVDSKFHPSLTQKIFSMFADASANPHGAQLIVTTHDVELMRSGMLSPRQIFFSEKNLRGESSLYSLADFRNSDQYRTPEIADRYLQGIFGAIPSFEEDVNESQAD